jgi:hypothetical protein
MRASLADSLIGGGSRAGGKRQLREEQLTASMANPWDVLRDGRLVEVLGGKQNAYGFCNGWTDLCLGLGSSMKHYSYVRVNRTNPGLQQQQDQHPEWRLFGANAPELDH